MLIALDFGCAFMLGLRDDSRTVCEGGAVPSKIRIRSGFGLCFLLASGP